MNPEDKEKIKFAGKILKGTEYSVCKQFRREIEDRRRELYPAMRKARENRKRQCKFSKRSIVRKQYRVQTIRS